MKRLFLLAMVVLTMGTAFAQSVTVMTVKMKDGAEVQFYADSVKKVTMTMPEKETVESKFIDLGLPSGLLWATCNEGANEPWEYGDLCIFDTANREREVYRLPTKKEMQELIDSCTWEWVTNYAGVVVSGKVGTSKYNGRQIFFPAAGWIENRFISKYGVGSSGNYWSGSLYADGSYGARYLYFNSSSLHVRYLDNSDYGYSVRLVCPAAE